MVDLKYLAAVLAIVFVINLALRAVPFAILQPLRKSRFVNTMAAWIPETTRPGTVAVVQMSHALADGRRATALMGRIFGRDQPVPAVVESRLGTWALPYRAWRASAAHRRLVHDTESGAVAAPADSWPVQATNNAPAGPDTMRTVVRHRTDLPGPTVTVGVLAAISEALAAELGGVTALGAEAVSYTHLRAHETN